MQDAENFLPINLSDNVRIQITNMNLRTHSAFRPFSKSGDMLAISYCCLDIWVLLGK